MLTEIEKKVVERAANRIVSDCITDNIGEAETKRSACIKDRAKGVEYMIGALQDLPKGHPTKPELPKLSDIAFNIKEDTTKWAVLRGIM